MAPNGLPIIRALSLENSQCVCVCACELSVCWCHWDSAHLPCKLLAVSKKLFVVIKPTGDPVQKDGITLVLSQGLTAIGFH